MYHCTAALFRNIVGISLYFRKSVGVGSGISNNRVYPESPHSDQLRLWSGIAFALLLEIVYGRKSCRHGWAYDPLPPATRVSQTTRPSTVV
jgi:hypothetical protein